MKTLPRSLIMVGLLALIAVLSVASMSAGRVWVPWSDWASRQGAVSYTHLTLPTTERV